MAKAPRLILKTKKTNGETKLSLAPRTDKPIPTEKEAFDTAAIKASMARSMELFG